MSFPLLQQWCDDHMILLTIGPHTVYFQWIQHRIGHPYKAEDCAYALYPGMPSDAEFAQEMDQQFRQWRVIQ